MTTTRKRKRGLVLKSSSLLRGTLALLVTALAFRLLVLSGAAAYLDTLLASAGADAGFVRNALNTELSGPRGKLPTWTEVLTGQAAALSAYAQKEEIGLPLEPPSEESVPPVPSETPTASPYRPPFPPLHGTDWFGTSRPSPNASPSSSLRPTASPPPAATTDDPSFNPAPADFVPLTATEITFRPNGEEGYASSGAVYVKNQTGLSLDVNALLNTEVRLPFVKNKPQILIIQTHGSESFLPDRDHYYVPTDTERTEDWRFNVIRVGEELKKQLEAQGFTVIQNREIFDEPTYSGSYTRSLEAIRKHLKENPSIQMVIDLHRDSIQAGADQIYKPVATVDGLQMAQMMLVVGTSDLGLDHPDWKQNMTLAVHLQQLLEQEHPTLMRPVDMRRERFNQHATAGSLLLEVGSSGNSLDEALRSVRLFAKTAGPYLQEMISE